MEALTWLTQGNGHTCKHAYVESQVCNVMTLDTAEKNIVFIKDFFSKCDQISSFLWIWSHLLKKSIMKDFQQSKY